LIAVESYALNGALVQIVKSTTGRARPNSSGTTTPLQWDGPFFYGKSFYSGHTSSAFSVASVIAYRYRDTPWVPWVSYGLATLGAMQRVYNNRHWASDVLFGSMVGTATGVFLCKTWEKRPLMVFPYLSAEVNGVSMIIPIRQ
jgi:membrane-associated phospholipid phosphatase